MSESGFFTRVRGKVSGPYSVEILRRMVRQGLLSRIHEISSDRASWARASDYEDLFPTPTSRGGSHASQEPILTPVPPANSMEFALTPGAPPKAKKFFYAQNGQSVGPVMLPLLRTLAHSGQLGPDDPVWEECSTTSLMARAHPALAGLFMAAPEPPRRSHWWVVILLLVAAMLASGILAGVMLWQKPAATNSSSGRN